MNNIERIFKESGSIESFASGYLDYLAGLFGKLDTGAIAMFVAELEEARKRGSTIFIIGNGGSAATASHMANDLGMDVLKKGTGSKPLRVLALTDCVPLMTAIANDDGYKNLFINQLRIHYRSGDKLVAISASGNSPNVVEAARWVKNKEGIVISLVGFNGGKLKDISDIAIHVDTLNGEYGPVEDVHLILDHLIACWLQYKVRE